MEKTALTIVKMLQDAGYETYFAGGCVRDILLKREPQDYDIVTAAKPDTIEDLLEKTIPIGKQFGVIMAIVDDHKFEIATFREDSTGSDGRRPHEIFFKSAKEDALRRDFTINGMFYDPVTKKTIDYVGGEDDIKEGVIRFIGTPEQRIKEDHLRMLRAIRFKNTFGFQYEPKTFQAIKKHSKLVSKLSSERVRDELNKIIQLKDVIDAFEDMDDLRVLDHILPEISAMKGVAQPKQYHQEGDVWTHSLLALKSLPKTASLNTRWAMLLHDVGKPQTYEMRGDRIHFDEHASVSADMSKKILRRLSFSNADIKEVCWIVSHHMMMGAFDEMTERRKLHWYHSPYFKNLLKVMRGDIMGSKPRNFDLYNSIKDDYRELIKKEQIKPLLTGKDLIKKFKLEPGPHLGELLKEVEKQHLEHKIHTKTEAYKVVEKLLKKKKK